MPRRLSYPFVLLAVSSSLSSSSSLLSTAHHVLTSWWGREGGMSNGKSLPRRIPHLMSTGHHILEGMRPGRNSSISNSTVCVIIVAVVIISMVHWSSRTSRWEESKMEVSHDDFHVPKNSVTSSASSSLSSPKLLLSIGHHVQVDGEIKTEVIPVRKYPP